MGNCLKSENGDSVSLLRGNEGTANNNFNNLEQSTIPPNNPSEMMQPSAMLHPTSSAVRTITLTEDEQIKVTKRLALIQHLPIGSYNDSKLSECVICMMTYDKGDLYRTLPCMHFFHATCIDDWLLRSFTCPSCMEPVDAALLNIYET